VAYKEAGFNNGPLKVTMAKGVRTTATETLPDRSLLGYRGTALRRAPLSPQVARHLLAGSESPPLPATLAGSPRAQPGPARAPAAAGGQQRR